MFEIRKAQKSKSKLRLGLMGTSGAGKTYSALLLAKGLVGDWEKVIVIDTENGSADLYDGLGGYRVITLTAPFSPERYIEAIHAAEEAGFEAIIVDSITHEWNGAGGCLELIEQITKASPAKNSYTAWAKVTPRHNAFVQSILQSPSHVITTVRRKQDYSMSTDSQGKTKIEKQGLKEVTRDDFEYELTLSFALTQNHLAETSKDRTGLFMDKPEFIISEATGKTLRDWSEKGIDPVPVITTLTPATVEQKERLREFMDRGLLDPAFADRLDQATFLKTEELIKRLETEEKQQETEIQEAQRALEKARAAAAQKDAPKTKAKAAPVEESVEVAE